MNKYLVRVFISRQGQSGSLRFVPLEIFDLRKAHMLSAHDCRVKTVPVSLWTAVGSSSGTQAPQGVNGPWEPVISVILQKMIAAVEMPGERYFAEEDFNTVLPKFLSHYGITVDGRAAMAKVQITRDFFLQPEEVLKNEL